MCISALMPPLPVRILGACSSCPPKLQHKHLHPTPHPAPLPAGITDELGVWVTPAFQLHTSKMDTVLPARTLDALRRPVPGPGAAPSPAAPRAPAASSQPAQQAAEPGGSSRGELQARPAMQCPLCSLFSLPLLPPLYAAKSHTIFFWPPAGNPLPPTGAGAAGFTALILDCDMHTCI